MRINNTTPKSPYERGFEDIKKLATSMSYNNKSNYSTTNFETELINVLNSIQLTLSCLIANRKEGDKWYAFCK